VATFEIKRVLQGSRSGLRRVAVVNAPTAMHALRKFADRRQAILRPEDDGRLWRATILMDNGTLRDFVASTD
jgi:hypothetical protein